MDTLALYMAQTAKPASEDGEFSREQWVRSMKRMLAQMQPRKAYANNESTSLTIPPLDVGEHYVIVSGETAMPAALDDKYLAAKIYKKPDHPELGDF